MVFASEPRGDAAHFSDTLDHVLAVCWALSDIAVETFGVLFWAALALAFLYAA